MGAAQMGARSGGWPCHGREEMHEDGYANITSVDISAAVIEKMRARHSKRRPPMTWLAMDRGGLGIIVG